MANAQEPKPTLPDQKHHKSKSHTNIPFFIASLALLLAGYNTYLTHQTQHAFAMEYQTVNDQRKQTDQQALDLAQTNKTQMQQIREQNAQLEEQINLFSITLEEVRKQKTSQTQDWLLLKARYYLELAQINAHWSTPFNDGSSAALLKQADLLLAQVNSPALFKIRQIMAQELLQLHQAQQVDIPGLLSQLDALQQEIMDWNMHALPSIQPEQASITDKTAPQEHHWIDRMNTNFSWLHQLVIIRHDTQHVKPLLSPLLESTLKASLRLNLQEAQWSIINANPMAYQLALKQAVMILQEHTNESLGHVTLWIQQLNALAAVNITPKQPQVGQALPLLNEFINTQHLLPASSSTPSKGE